MKTPTKILQILIVIVVFSIFTSFFAHQAKAQDVNAVCAENCTDEAFPFGYCGDGGNIPDDCARPPLDPGGAIDCPRGDIPSGCGDCLCCESYRMPLLPECRFDAYDAYTTPRPSMGVLCGDVGINTAIGCIPVGNRQAFLVFVLRWAIGISGGVALIMIVYSGILIMSSGGDKQRLQTGKEFLTAAIAGLMLIIFSVFILQLIGVSLFRIPGL